MKWDDQSATIQNLGVLAPSNAACLRIYRTSASFNIDPKVTNIAFDTTFQLLAELPLPVASNTFVDNLRLRDIEWGTLMTADHCPPPQCMGAVQYMETGYWVGFHGNELFISEKNEFYNWPEKYRVRLPDKITGLVVFGDMIFLGTSGTPYRIKVVPLRAHKTEEFDSDIQVMPYGENYPCLHPRVMTRTSWGAAYVSKDGIVGLQPAGVASLMTRHRIDPDEWVKYIPNQIAWHDGRLYGVRTITNRRPGDKTLAWLMDFVEKGEGGAVDHGDFVLMNIPADEVVAGNDGHMYYTDGPKLHRFAQGQPLRSYTWRSHRFVMDGIVRLGAVRIIGRYGPPVELRIYADGKLVHTCNVTGNHPHRLPQYCRSRVFEIELRGSTHVDEITLAPSIRDLDTKGTDKG
jgi:hypothetical protein